MAIACGVLPVASSAVPRHAIWGLFRRGGLEGNGVNMIMKHFGENL